MKFSEFKYVRLNYEDLKAKYERLLAKLKAAETAGSFMETFDEINAFIT